MGPPRAEHSAAGARTMVSGPADGRDLYSAVFENGTHAAESCAEEGAAERSTGNERSRALLGITIIDALRDPAAAIVKPSAGPCVPDCDRPPNTPTGKQRLQRAVDATVPWLLVAAVFGVSVYVCYAFVIMLCFQTLLSDDFVDTEETRAILYLSFGIPVALIALGHYVAAVFVPAGSPLDYRRISVRPAETTRVDALTVPAPQPGPTRDLVENGPATNDQPSRDQSSDQRSESAAPLCDRVITPDDPPVNTASNDSNRPNEPDLGAEYFVVRERPRRVVRVSCARYCASCAVAKPPRCHHCSTCARCVLRMDHHCPWLNNCVGARNYKLFVLMLLWACAAAWFFFGAFLQFLTHIPASSDGSVVFAGLYVNFIVAAAACAIVGILAAALLVYHVRLIVLNRTTIEQLEHMDALRLPDADRYDGGVCHNVRQILGRNPWLWLVPVAPWRETLCGFVFPLPKRNNP